MLILVLILGWFISSCFWVGFPGFSMITRTCSRTASPRASNQSIRNFPTSKAICLTPLFLQNSRKSSLTFIPRLIYNRTIRAIENLRGKEEIELVTLVNNFEKIEERFKRRKDFLNEQCEKLGLNETTDTYDLDDITDNILAGKSLEIFSHLILVIKKFTFSLNYLKKNHHKISLK